MIDAEPSLPSPAPLLAASLTQLNDVLIDME